MHEILAPFVSGRREGTRYYQTCLSPIFIIGSPLSGTSVLAWALAQHGGLWTSRERDVLFNLFGSGHAETAWKNTNDRVEGNWMKEQGMGRYEFLEYLGAGLNALFTHRSGGRRWIDQTPVNTFMPDVLVELYSEAKFIHMLRDGRRVVHSMINFGRAYADDVRQEMIRCGQLATWGSSFVDACDTWRMFVDTAMEFAPRRPVAVLTVLNEDLVSDPQGGLNRICEFLEVDSRHEAAAFFQSNRINSSFTPDGVAVPRPADLSTPWKQWTVVQHRMYLDATSTVCQKYDLRFVDEIDPARIAWAEQIIQKVTENTPQGAVVAVVSKQDELMLHIPGCIARHFPCDASGKCTWYPADGAAAIEQVEQAVQHGVQYLVVPQPALWWLSHCDGLRNYLGTTHQIHSIDDNTCAIFRLNTPNASEPIELYDEQASDVG